MLDLMNPVTAFGRLVGQAWKLRRDKAKARSAGHTLFNRTGVPSASQLAAIISSNTASTAA